MHSPNKVFAYVSMSPIVVTPSGHEEFSVVVLACAAGSSVCVPSCEELLKNCSHKALAYCCMSCCVVTPSCHEEFFVGNWAWTSWRCSNSAYAYVDVSCASPNVVFASAAGTSVAALSCEVLLTNCSTMWLVPETIGMCESFEGDEEVMRVNDQCGFYTNFSPALRETTERMHLLS